MKKLWKEITCLVIVLIFLLGFYLDEKYPTKVDNQDFLFVPM